MSAYYHAHITLINPSAYLYRYANDDPILFLPFIIYHSTLLYVILYAASLDT